MYRLRFVAPVLLVGFVTSGFLMGDDKKSDKEPIIVKARLPAYYSKLGLSAKQKKDIYLIQAKYASKIEALQEQIATLKAKQKTDLENVLTAGQKALLREMRGSSKEKDVQDVKEKEIKGKPAEIKKP
jgi:hypothetical protein